MKADNKKDGLIQCPLCGFKFSCDEATNCFKCPLSKKSCKGVTCPNCSYHFPPLGA